MAVGDLILGPSFPQYEFNSLLFGSGTDLIVVGAKGLLGTSETKNTDAERQDAWGDFPGTRGYKARYITFDITALSESRDTIEDYVDLLPQIFQVDDTPGQQQPRQLVYQRTVAQGKRFLWATVEKCDFDSNSDVAHGLLAGSVMLKCNDPRKYSLIQLQTNVTIPNGQNNVNAMVATNGGIRSAPLINISGPCTNPRIQNQQDSNKTIKIDIVIPSGHTLNLDFRSRTVMMDGVDMYGYVRSDNQWWKLAPGNNSITFTRSDSGAPSTAAFFVNDVWS